MDIEDIFDLTKWERKFEGQLPPSHCIKHVWHLTPMPNDSPIAILKRITRGIIHEETKRVCRALCLCNDSLGEVLIMTEESW